VGAFISVSFGSDVRGAGARSIFAVTGTPFPTFWHSARRRRLPLGIGQTSSSLELELEQVTIVSDLHGTQLDPIEHVNSR